MNLVYLGRKPVPQILTEPVNAIRKNTNACICADPGRYKDNVVQFHVIENPLHYKGNLEQSRLAVAVAGPVRGIFPKETRFDEDLSILGFKNVDEHTDFWPGVCLIGKNRFHRPLFHHWVLRGTFDLTVGKTKMTFKKGDVFAMDPNVKHFVKTPLTCVTVCKTIRAVDLEMFRITQDLKGADHENVHHRRSNHRGTHVPRDHQRP